MYTTQTGFKSSFTVITAEKVYRVRAFTEAAVRSSFAQVGIPILGIDRDTDE